MIQSQNLKGLVIKSLVITGLWTIVILLISSITILTTLQEGSAVDTLGVIAFELICISPWILFTPAIIWLARSYKFEAENIYASVGIHLVAMLLLFCLHSLVQSFTVSYYYEVSFTWDYIQRDFLGFIDMRVMLYAGILLGVYTMDFHRKNREIRLKEPRLKAELNQAKFHALLNQIQPDFLLKSIDSIKNSLDRSEEESEEVLTEFSDLLRIMLANVQKDEVILQEDLKAFQLYTNILGKRLGQKIEIEENIDDKCYDALVPSFLILVPLFEQMVDALNPSRHIISRISYNAEFESGMIRLEVRIEGENIPYQKLPDYIGNTEILKIVEKYQTKHEDVEFKTSAGKNGISIHLIFPFYTPKGNELSPGSASDDKIVSLYS